MGVQYLKSFVKELLRKDVDSRAEVQTVLFFYSTDN